MESQSRKLADLYPEGEYERPLRILVDGRKIFDGGIGVYTRNLLRGLSTVPSITLGVVLAPGANLSSDWLNKVKVFRDAARPYSLDEYLRFSSRIPFDEFDIFHVPHYVLPKRLPIPAVVTVHDLIHVTHPKRWFYPSISKVLINDALRRSCGVLTVSNSSRDAISSIFPKWADKVRVIPNCIDDSFWTPSHVAPITSEKFFLCVSSQLSPHKGVQDLISAYIRAGRFNNLPKLILVGQGVKRAAKQLNKLSGDNPKIEIVGAVSREQLRDFYREAQALVVPSLEEGFCLPVLEAKACGCPVIARPVSAVCELLEAGDIKAANFSTEALEIALLKGADLFLGKSRGRVSRDLSLYSQSHFT
ncbi:MAG: glycosyltransferase family 4 protein, partial [Bdellovibrionales bacterium]|nr:glycosyltransferase family 4 protein [Bdellovibrionales bacterium]